MDGGCLSRVAVLGRTRSTVLIVSADRRVAVIILTTPCAAAGLSSMAIDANTDALTAISRSKAPVCAPPGRSGPAVHPGRDPKRWTPTRHACVAANAKGTQGCGCMAHAYGTCVGTRRTTRPGGKGLVMDGAARCSVNGMHGMQANRVYHLHEWQCNSRLFPCRSSRSRRHA